MKSREGSHREGGSLAWILGLIVLVALGGFQVSPLAQWGAVRVDVLLAASMAWAALAGPRRGLVFGMASGIVQDFLVGGGVTFTALRGLLGFLAGTVRPVLNLRQAVFIVPLVAAATVAQEALLALLHRNWPHFVAIWLPAVVSNALVSWPLYLAFRAIWRPWRAAGASPAPRRT
ncbi:MAG: hypothetical protein FJZ01_12520 [Candidatus Sericytochromatia bacterium]|nr:hypothetical protein [Candidatus Tanganyikabacteria bacterium]